jgi:hypothetical protein
MVERPDLHPPPDDQPDVDKFAALADAPLTALGLSSSDADALEQVLGVKSVRDLADNKYVRRAQAIVNLRTKSDHGDLLPCPRAGIGRVRGGWAAIHDRGTAGGWPPALGRAALPGAEPSRAGVCSGCRPSHGDGGRPRGTQPKRPQTRHSESSPKAP